MDVAVLHGAMQAFSPSPMPMKSMRLVLPAVHARLPHWLLYSAASSACRQWRTVAVSAHVPCVCSMRSSKMSPVCMTMHAFSALLAACYHLQSSGS